MEPKFRKGDQVMIRPFDTIDQDDIGRVGMNEHNCFSIPRSHIDRQSEAEEPYVVTRIDDEYGTYVYRIRPLSSDESITYWWAQGMLRGYEEAEELPDADEDGLFGLLIVEAAAG